PTRPARSHRNPRDVPPGRAVRTSLRRRNTEGRTSMTDKTVDPTGPAVIRPGDPRDENLVQGFNHRFVGRPDEGRLVTATEEVVAAVDEAVAAGRRIAVRSGGHCFENFTTSPEIEILLDLSELNRIAHDPARRAIEVGSGALLGDVYRTLFKRWGVT